MACLRLGGKQLSPPSPLLGLELVPGMSGCPRNGDRDGAANLQLWWGKYPPKQEQGTSSLLGQQLCFGAATHSPWLWDRKFQEKTLHTRKFGKPPCNAPLPPRLYFARAGGSSDPACRGLKGKEGARSCWGA